MSGYVELGKLVVDEAKNVYAIYKELKPAQEALSGAQKSFDMAIGAMSGKLGANDETIEEIRAYMEGIHGALVELSKQDENFWMVRSGRNSFQSSTLVSATAKLTGWIAQFQGMSDAIDQMLPLANGTAKVSGTFLGQVIDLLHSGPTSLVGLDTIALKEIAVNLAASKWEIGKIIPKLQTCLKVLKKS